MDAVLYTAQAQASGSFDWPIRLWRAQPSNSCLAAAIGRFHYLPSVVYIINCVFFAHFAQERKALARHVDP